MTTRVALLSLTFSVAIWVGGCPPEIAQLSDNSNSGTATGTSENSNSNANSGSNDNSSPGSADSGRNPPPSASVVSDVLGPLGKSPASNAAVRVQVVNQSALRFEARVSMKSKGIEVRFVRSQIAAETVGNLVGPDRADAVDIQLVPIGSADASIQKSFVLGADFNAGETIVIRIPAELGRPKPPPVTPPFDPTLVEPVGVDDLPVDSGEVLTVGGNGGGA